MTNQSRPMATRREQSASTPSIPLHNLRMDNPIILSYARYYSLTTLETNALLYKIHKGRWRTGRAWLETRKLAYGTINNIEHSIDAVSNVHYVKEDSAQNLRLVYPHVVSYHEYRRGTQQTKILAEILHAAYDQGCPSDVVYYDDVKSWVWECDMRNNVREAMAAIEIKNRIEAG